MRGCVNIKKKSKYLMLHWFILIYFFFSSVKVYFLFLLIHFYNIAIFINICMCLAFLLIIIVQYWMICQKGQTTFIIHILISLWLWQREIIGKAQTTCKQTQYMTTNLQAKTTFCYFGSTFPYWSGFPFHTRENDHYRQVFVCHLNAF